jgi:hypothetical protein
MFPYKSPEYCSRCGSPSFATAWKASLKTDQFNLGTFLTTWFGINIPRYAPKTYNVPICNVCEAQLEKINKLTRRITIFMAALLGLLFGIVYWARGVQGHDLVTGIPVVLILMLVGAIIGAFGGIVFGLVIQEALNYEFCSYDGQYYHFKNKKFRREFAILNPTLVKQKKK